VRGRVEGKSERRDKGDGKHWSGNKRMG